MRIALVELRSRDYLNIYSLFPMPRGICQLAAILKEKNYYVTCFAEVVQGFKIEDLFDYDLIGFSIITCTANPTYKMIRGLRKRGYSGTIVVGGPHATSCPTESLEAGANFVVRGEGDITLQLLVERIENEEETNTIAGISFFQDSGICHNPRQKVLSTDELSTLPLPAYNLIAGFEKLRYIAVTFSRGCPFACDFCAVEGMFGRGYRSMNLEGRLRWLREIKEKYPNLKVFFADDNFFGDDFGKIISKEMLKQMIAQELMPKSGWLCQMRVTDADRETTQLMLQAGCNTVCLGIESPNIYALKAVKKGIKPEEIEQGISNLNEAGIETLAMTIAGIDTDTFSSFFKGIRMLTKWGITYLQILAIVPLPDTKMTRRLTSEGRKFSSNYDRYNGMHVLLRPQKMNKLRVWMCVYLVTGWFYFISPNGRKLLKTYFGRYCKMVWLVFAQHISLRNLNRS